METKKDDFWSKSILLMLALLLLLIIALCSCTTSKPMVYERTIVRTDTVIKADTTWHNRFVENIVDNVSKQFSSIKDSVATVVDEQGNVKKHEAWHWRENSTQTSTEKILRDSLEDFKGRYFALLTMKADSLDKTYKPPSTYTTQTPTYNLWERWCIEVGRAVTIGLIVSIVSLLLYAIRKKK